MCEGTVELLDVQHISFCLYACVTTTKMTVKKINTDNTVVLLYSIRLFEGLFEIAVILCVCCIMH